MTASTNRTHDPSARSWVASAQRAGTDFPIQNLPFGVFRRRDGGAGQPRIGVAIGEEILDLALAADAGSLQGLDPDVLAAVRSERLNGVMALAPEARAALRERLFDLLREGSKAPASPATLVSASQVELLLPAEIGDYTDFYTSVFHATNVGSMFRPDNPLLPNYKYVPIGYHGRSSSIVVSGTPVVRPSGQLKDDAAPAPVLGPTKGLDYECEVGAFVANGNPLGTPVPLADAERHLFGLCLLNDWSARDVQRWEYQPLGPFLAKNFATTISPWVVTMEALAPFRVPAFSRPASDPEPLPYLSEARDRASGGIAMAVEVWLGTAAMRAAGMPPVRLSESNLATMYWTMAQLVAHHTSNGCNLRPGDLFGSGTLSGPTRESRGCLLELTWRGTEPLTLPSGEERRFLQNGDEVILRGHCHREGFASIGFGECRGVVESA